MWIGRLCRTIGGLKRSNAMHSTWSTTHVEVPTFPLIYGQANFALGADSKHRPLGWSRTVLFPFTFTCFDSLRDGLIIKIKSLAITSETVLVVSDGLTRAQRIILNTIENYESNFGSMSSVEWRWSASRFAQPHQLAGFLVFVFFSCFFSTSAKKQLADSDHCRAQSLMWAVRIIHHSSE